MLGHEEPIRKKTLYHKDETVKMDKRSNMQDRIRNTIFLLDRQMLVY